MLSLLSSSLAMLGNFLSSFFTKKSPVRQLLSAGVGETTAEWISLPLNGQVVSPPVLNFSASLCLSLLSLYHTTTTFNDPDNGAF